MSTRTLLFTDCVDFVGAACKAFAGMKKYVSTGAVDVDHINDSETEIVDYDGKPSRANLEVMAGDVLFAKMQGTKKTLLIDPVLAKHIYSTGFCAVRAKKAILTERCLYHILMSEMFLSQKDKNCSGTTQKAITNAGLGKIAIHVPSVEEQINIADQLDAVIGIITKRQQELSALDDLIKARFVEMFGNIHDSDKFPYIPVKKLTNVVSGGTPSRDVSEYWDNGDIPWVKTTELKNSVIESIDEYITEKGKNNSAAKIVPVGTVLVAMYGQGKTRGMTGYLGIEATTNQACACILPSNHINMMYLWKYFELSYDKLRSLAQGGGQPNLNGNMIKTFPVLVPPREMQDGFVLFVNHVNKSKVVVQKALDEAQVLFDSLMQQYFG